MTGLQAPRRTLARTRRNAWGDVALSLEADRLLEGGTDTASSPKGTYTRAELGRYLDYCSGKIWQKIMMLDAPEIFGGHPGAQDAHPA